MKPEEFRSFMVDRIREFDNWAWLDIQQNPEDWTTMSKRDLFDMFETFIKDDLSE